MASITYPTDFLIDWPGWTTSFEPMYRQEESRTQRGETRTKDMGTPLWRGSWTTVRLKPNAFEKWKAVIEALENGNRTFRAFSHTKRYPAAHPNGVGLPGGTITVGSIQTDRDGLALSGASGLTLDIGDLIEIGGSVYRVQSQATGSAAFAVRPYLSLTVSTGNTVIVDKPSCIMRVVPGSLQASADTMGRGSVSFSAMQAI